jgi:hypothetical protein
MYIKKTTLLPENDLQLADAIFDTYLHEHRKTLFVVLGDDEIARRLVEKADRWAGLLEEPRWVLWVRNKSQMPTLALELHDPNKLVTTTNWDSVLGFTVSVNDNICEIIPYTTEEIRSTRIIRAYAKAEADNLKSATTTIVVAQATPPIRSRGLALPSSDDSSNNPQTSTTTQPIKAKSTKPKAKAKTKPTKAKTTKVPKSTTKKTTDRSVNTNNDEVLPDGSVG